MGREIRVDARGARVRERAAAAAPLPRGTPPARLPGAPALEAGAGDPTPPLIPTPRSSRSPPSSRPTPPAVQVPSRVLRDPAELFLPPGSSIYYVHVLAPPAVIFPSPRLLSI